MSQGKDMIRKDEAQLPAEQTKSEPVFTPAVDIYQTEEELVILADMPGVHPEKLAINLEDNTLTLEGEIGDELKQAGEMLLNEYGVGRYWRQFSLGEAIDRENIQAHLKNGELRLVLPKAAAAKPQRIAVKTA